MFCYAPLWRAQRLFGVTPIHLQRLSDIIHVVTTQLAGTSTERTIDELHARVEPPVVWLVRQSHSVNINTIKEIVPWWTWNDVLKMKDTKDSQMPAARIPTRLVRDYLKLSKSGSPKSPPPDPWP